MRLVLHLRQHLKRQNSTHMTNTTLTYESAKIDSRTDSANKDRKDVNDKRQRQQQLKQAQLNDYHQRGAVSGVEHVYTEVNDEKVSFGLPPESSQFYQKCPK